MLTRGSQQNQGQQPKQVSPHLGQWEHSERVSVSSQHWTSLSLYPSCSSGWGFGQSLTPDYLHVSSLGVWLEGKYLQESLSSAPNPLPYPSSLSSAPYKAPNPDSSQLRHSKQLILNRPSLRNHCLLLAHLKKKKKFQAGLKGQQRSPRSESP